MGPNMLLEVRQLCEFPLTDLTTVRFYAQMDPGMLGQIGTICERLATL